MSKTMIVTTALCYANGPFHLGHLVEQIQADIWVRAQRAQGHQCIFLSGEDAHGSAIMLAAKKAGVSTEDYLAQVLAPRLNDLADFNISYDTYHSTDTPENKALCYEIYDRLNDHISTKDIQQLYDSEANMFLPDRFIKGTCPKCGAEDQYGDNCEQCGACYDSTELLNPVSTLSQSKPELRTSKHFFFELVKQQAFIIDWLKKADIQPQAINKLNEWLKEPLQDWDISRDAPYFGFEIPNQPGKFFYVWLDAPIGYMAALKAYCQKNPEHDFNALWWEKGVPVYHFIGKDILYFHAIFWPAVLNAAGLKAPDGVFTHGFLTINKVKMSKSRGTFITARQFLDHYPSDALRYYFASKLSNGIQDIDLDWPDFIQKINTDLVGKLVNIGSRCARIIEKHFESSFYTDADAIFSHPLFEQLSALKPQILEAYDNRQFNTAVKLIMQGADLCNQFIDTQQPWSKVKQGLMQDGLLDCSIGFFAFLQLISFIAPITPDLADRVSSYIEQPLSLDVKYFSKLNQSFPRLFERLSLVDFNEPIQS